MAVDHDLGGILLEKTEDFPVEPQSHHCKMDQEKIDLVSRSQLDTNRHGVRPVEARRVGVSPDVDRLADCFQFCDQIKVSDVSGVENQGGMKLLKNGEEAGMRLSVRVGENRDDPVLDIAQVDRSGGMSVNHRISESV